MTPSPLNLSNKTLPVSSMVANRYLLNCDSLNAILYLGGRPCY